MPVVQPPATVLITGASGFIAAWTVREFLERGYAVRGTVRSAAKGEWLKEQNWVKDAKGSFEFAVVSDIEAKDAFDDFMSGIDVVVHMASPVAFSEDIHPDELIKPAVNGTLSVLKSAAKHKSVKKVVITASVASLLEPHEGAYTYTEKDWNVFSVAESEKKGAAAAGVHKYRASKVRAEQAAWKFVEENKETLGFDVTTILPPFVYGPMIHQVTQSLNMTPQLFLDGLTGNPNSAYTPVGNFVDVRDVARAHAEAVGNVNAKNERLIVAGGPFVWQNIYDFLNAQSVPGILIGEPGSGKDAAKTLKVIFSTEKVQRLLGFTFRTPEETAEDAARDLVERGFLKA